MLFRLAALPKIVDFISRFKFQFFFFLSVLPHYRIIQFKTLYIFYFTCVIFIFQDNRTVAFIFT